MYFSASFPKTDSGKNFIKITDTTKLIIRILSRDNFLVEDKIVSQIEVFDFSISENYSYASHRKVLKSVIEKSVKEFLLKKNLYIGLASIFKCEGVEFSITLNSAKTAEKMYEVPNKLTSFYFSEDAQFTLQPGIKLTKPKIQCICRKFFKAL